jgi:hypothetical protein
MDSISAFFAVKYLAYLAIIYVGFRYLNPTARLLILKALALALWRMFMGIAVFLIIGLFVVMKYGNGSNYPEGFNPYAFHFFIMVPERLLTWGIITLMIGGTLSRRHLIWLLVAIAISMGFDLFLFTVGGFELNNTSGHGWC